VVKVLYEKTLKELGISDSRNYGLACKIRDLHGELCKLDKRNFEIIKEITLNKLLKKFSEVEELRILEL
jgi:hypothetical protein